MALRAGYYGVKRGLKDKLAQIAAAWDATVASIFPRSEQAVLGAKNLLPVPYSMASGSENGVTWSTNSDGTVTVSTPNGPSTGQANIHLLRSANFPSALLNVPLKLCGCPSGGSNTTYQMGVYHYDGTNSVNDYGDGTESFTFTSGGEKQLSITIRPNVTISTPITFKPMLTLASDTECDYAHYAPYARTNRELTESVQTDKTTINAIISAATGAADFTAFKTAMGAITPVTRSLSMAAAPEEIVKDEIEEPIVEKKTTRKKSTAKADTIEEV